MRGSTPPSDDPAGAPVGSTTPALPPRRQALRHALGLGVAAMGASAAHAAPPAGSPADVARDEAYWSRVAALYRLDPSVTNLENGFYGIMARPVLARYQQHIEALNLRNSLYLRQDYARDAEQVRTRVAAAVGATPGEIALTRGATEALQNLIVNYRGLKTGDTVLYADLDHDSGQSAVDHLAAQRGAHVAKLVVPEPATHQRVIDAYAEALKRHPRTRLLLLTHVNNKTGLVLPVAEIAKLARQRGVDVVLDAAHSFGQLDFTVADLGVDFIAFNLHKWIGAPLGVGFLYIRKGRLDAIAPHLVDADEARGPDDVRRRVHSGTTNTANVLTVPTALDLHLALGAAHKEARVRYLRDRWVTQARALGGIDILTPDDPRLVAGITGFRLAGKPGRDDNRAVATALRERHGIFTVARGGLASGDVVRVTPALFTRAADVDRLAEALRDIVARPPRAA
ncbi:MAG TPA: aminotransferase class V-fold PLP-dependent enzyme [Candidatus Aquabacterium excrementipullorum]|nr:aminotransferase class V-fold PLP-dependent enzyme [Candidatus Aquabacterium excrementipullorum]